MIRELPFKVRISLIVVLVLLLCGTATCFNRSDKPPTITTYEVVQGDTLWTIAKLHCPPDIDIRDYIDDIKHRNGLNGATIHAGTNLEVMIYELDK